MLLCVNDPRTRFEKAARQTLEEAMPALAQRGIPAARVESALAGGSDAAPWKTEAWLNLAREFGLEPERLDLNGQFYRQVRFDPAKGDVSITKQPASDDQWNPAAASLGLADGSRVFAEGHTVANATRFFREKKTFSALEEAVVPEHARIAPSAPFKLWCAACSAGAEAYSYAMFLHELFARKGIRCALHVFGTDINENLIAQARQGTYDVHHDEMEAYRKYFTQYAAMSGTRATFTDEIKRFVTFRVHDLRERPRKHLFRVIICANVFQYYQDDARSFFLENLLSVLERPGYLFVGPLRREMQERAGLTRLAGYGMFRLD